jgi:hypothetical protein
MTQALARVDWVRLAEQFEASATTDARSIELRLVLDLLADHA